MDTIYHAFDIRKHEFVELIHAWQHRLNVPQLPPGYRTAKQAFDDLEAALEALQADLGTRCKSAAGNLPSLEVRNGLRILTRFRSNRKDN